MKTIRLDLDGKIFVDGIEYGPINQAKVPEPKKEITCNEDLGTVGGFYINGSGDIEEIQCMSSCHQSKGLFPTREEADAALAMSQLCQLRDRANEGWRYDKRLHESEMYSRYSAISKELTVWDNGSEVTPQSFLTFNRHDVAWKFLTTHKELIKKALPLM
jgi:hypothetical protein